MASAERIRLMDAEVERSQASAAHRDRRKALLECGHVMQIGSGRQAWRRLHCFSCRQLRAVLSIEAR